MTEKEFKEMLDYLTITYFRGDPLACYQHLLLNQNKCWDEMFHELQLQDKPKAEG